MKHALQAAVSATFLLSAVFAFAQTTMSQPSAAAREIHRYVIVKGNTLSGSWDSYESPNAQALRARYGDHFAWFREGGREYIITDPDVLAELDKAEEPQKKVNASQSGGEPGAGARE